MKHKQEVQKVTKQVKNYLLHVDSLQFKRDQVLIVDKLYAFLCEHKWFMKDFPKFAKVAHDTLFELIQDADFLTNGLKYATRLFGLQPPKQYYNSRLGLTQYGLFDIHGKFVPLTLVFQSQVLGTTFI